MGVPCAFSAGLRNVQLSLNAIDTGTCRGILGVAKITHDKVSAV